MPVAAFDARLMRTLQRLMLGLIACAVTLRGLAGAGPGLGVDLFVHSLVWLAGLVWAVLAAAEGRLRVRGTGLEIPLVALFLVAGASPIVAEHKLPAFARASEIWSSIVLFFLLVNLPGPRTGLRTVLMLLTGTALVNAVIGGYQVGFFYEEMRRNVLAGRLPPGIRPELQAEFVARALTPEAFGTLVLSNSLAGFLLLVLPAAVYGAWRGWRSANRGDGVVWTVVAAVLCAGLALTRSKGGWLAAAGGLLALGALRAWSRSPRWRKAMVAGAVLALLAVGGAASSGLLRGGMLRRLGASASVRLDFWRGALRVIDEAPVVGVGLGNFEEHYLKHKPASAQETVHVHNDYLDAWAESGIVGAAAFLALWGAFVGLVLRAGSRPTAPADATAGDDTEGNAASAWAVTAGGAAAFALAVAMGLAFRDDLGASITGLLAFAAWLAWMRWSARAPIPAGSTACALAAGVAGFLLHAAIDFDWQVPAITQGVLALLAAWSCATTTDERPPAVDASLGPVGRWLVPLPFAVAVLVMAGFFLPRAQRADAAFDEAESLLAEAAVIRERAHARGETGAADEPARRVLAAYRRAEEVLGGALAANPWDVRLHVAFVQAASGRLLDADAGLKDEESEARFEELKAVMEHTVALDPADAALRARLGELWELRAARLEARARADASKRDRLAMREQEAMTRALAAYGAAVERYPACPGYRYQRARLLDRMGRQTEARAEYARAMALSGEQMLERLRLPPDILKAIDEKLMQVETPPGK